MDNRAVILIVDDAPDNMSLCSSLLQDRYKIIKMTNGDQALDWLQENTPDLGLIDHTLPDGPGDEIGKNGVYHLVLFRHRQQVPDRHRTAGGQPRSP